LMEAVVQPGSARAVLGLADDGRDGCSDCFGHRRRHCFAYLFNLRGKRALKHVFVRKPLQAHRLEYAEAAMAIRMYVHFAMAVGDCKRGLIPMERLEAAL